MKKSLKQFLPFAEGFARLLHPHGEVVIHDLEKDAVAAIFNPLSKRVVGDPSYLESLQFDGKNEIIGPYEKINWDGRKMKSISMVIRNQKGKPEGFLCVNFDLSSFHKIEEIIHSFVGKNNHEEVEELFKDDLHEKVNKFVKGYCEKYQLTIEGLTRKDKKKIIHEMEAIGVFDTKNAASYIARVLGISRATVYNLRK